MEHYGDFYRDDNLALLHLREGIARGDNMVIYLKSYMVDKEAQDYCHYMNASNKNRTYFYHAPIDLEGRKVYNVYCRSRFHTDLFSDDYQLIW